MTNSGTSAPDTVPVALFAYARPDCLARTLGCLRENQVPTIYAFCDAAKTPEKEPAVHEVRRMIREIDWCRVVLHEREINMGTGGSIRDGVTRMLQEYDRVIVFEDDLICVPGTYGYLCAALEHYREDPRVTEVTGWTNPNIAPRKVGHLPYFDAIGESYAWGTWARAWVGMEESAMSLMARCRSRGIDVYRYGPDFPDMAENEERRNIWAVRFIYLQMLHGGLCMRPPWSLVESIGVDERSSNVVDWSSWTNPPLRGCPPIPTRWPKPREHRECARRWRDSSGGKWPAVAPRSRAIRVLLRLKKAITGAFRP